MLPEMKSDVFLEQQFCGMLNLLVMPDTPSAVKSFPVQTSEAATGLLMSAAHQPIRHQTKL